MQDQILGCLIDNISISQNYQHLKWLKACIPRAQAPRWIKKRGKKEKNKSTAPSHSKKVIFDSRLNGNQVCPNNLCDLLSTLE